MWFKRVFVRVPRKEVTRTLSWMRTTIEQTILIRTFFHFLCATYQIMSSNGLDSFEDITPLPKRTRILSFGTHKERSIITIAILIFNHSHLCQTTMPIAPWMYTTTFTIGRHSVSKHVAILIGAKELIGRIFTTEPKRTLLRHC